MLELPGDPAHNNTLQVKAAVCSAYVAASLSADHAYGNRRGMQKVSKNRWLKRGFEYARQGRWLALTGTAAKPATQVQPWLHAHAIYGVKVQLRQQGTAMYTLPCLKQ